MRSTNSARRLLGVAVSALVAVPALPALGQGGGGIELEEIVVTARKREENLQQTPIAVSAFSGESLARQGIMNVADFNKAIPGIDVHAGSGVAGVANIYIRGVGQRNTEPNLDSGVGIYLDGVYVSRADGALFDMNDVQSVQVLRGPQGTLFGKNTTGGAMLIETNRPSEELEGKVSMTVGNYDQLNGAVVLNLPLVDDTLYTRLSLLSIKRDGYIDNELLDTTYNDEDRLSAIWQLRWIASENLVADLNLNYSKTDQRPRGLQCIPSSVNFGQGWSAVLQNDRLIEPSHGGKSVEDFCLESAALDNDKIIQNLGGGYNADTKGAAVTLNWDLGEGMSLKSITAWRGTYAGQSDDLEPLPIAWQERTNGDHPFAKDRETEQWSQELDLTGEAMDGRLNYIAGLYYFTEETDKSRTVGLTGPFYIENPALPPSLDVVNYNGTGTDLWTDNESYAAFLQGDWSISDKWKLTTGVRYTSETRELTRTSWLPDVPTLSTGSLVATVGTNTYLMFADTFVANHGFVVSDLDQADTDADDWTPLVSLSYLLDGVGFIESGSTYITVSKGFRSGGLSEAPSADLEEYEPEEVISTELGLKFDALDSRLRMNLAVFDLQYEDRQLTTIAVSPQGRIAGATINAKDSWVRGVELESTFLPVDNLELTFTGSWYDNDIEEYEDVQLSLTSATTLEPGCVFTLVPGLQSCIIDRSDEDLPRLPEKTLLLAAQYYFQTSIGTIIPRIQYSKKYAVDGCFDRNSCISGDFLQDLEDLSARVTWLSTEGDWSISAYGSNLQDEEQIIGGQPLYDTWGFGGVTYAPPRMYGAEFTYNW